MGKSYWFSIFKRAKMFDLMGWIEVPSVSRKWIAGRFGVELSPQNHTLKSAKNRGNKIVFYFCKKGTRLKTMSYRTLGFPEYGMTNASKFKWGYTPDSNPKRGNTKMGKKIDINLCETPRLRNSVIAYLIVFSEYGMTNASISSLALALTATPKWVKRG